MSLNEDAASYQQVKKRLAAEGFDNLDALIERFKQVMIEENEASIAMDKEIESLRAQLDEVQLTGKTARVARIDLCETRERVEGCEVCTLKCVSCIHWGNGDDASDCKWCHGGYKPNYMSLPIGENWYYNELPSYEYYERDGQARFCRACGRKL